MQKNIFKDATLFAIEVFGGGLIAAQFHITVLFRCLPGQTLLFSKLVFWLFWACLLMIGFLSTPGRKRHVINSTVTALMPVSTYFLISYHDIYEIRLKIACFCIATCILLVSALVLWAGFTDIQSGIIVKKLKSFLWGYFHKCRMIVGLILSMVYLLSVLGIIYSGAVLTPKQSADTPITNYSTIENNLDTISLLQEDIWKNLSLQDRVNVLQMIANIEASYLGLPHELNVISAVMDEETLGYYNDQIHTIAFNIDFLRQGNSADILETLSHEAFHAYEHRLVDLYEHAADELKDLRLLRSAKIYSEEFKNYIDGTDDPIGYFFQTVEFDSDAYAAATVQRYFDAIPVHQDNTEQG